eukprot:CAMPEP_0202476136 /NCGR_PEP_ID=MMETSP1360-20130828/93267_1 /ASSEMBLY_ACC=CAM_ASM_000848 /TAXON_ID=515479 /ORGANISM="Licmophora paradoxa, Strain CCMP2313" /LENGTH=100 /DNA_ID=CAMNT_0049103333 /DNA_START=1566 /DNA_END=1863 /DNA_ORIENTATION=+
MTIVFSTVTQPFSLSTPMIASSSDPKKQNIDKATKNTQKIFDVEDEGAVDDYLGVKINQLNNGSFELTQPRLIDSILKDFNQIQAIGKPKENIKTKRTPA